MKTNPQIHLLFAFALLLAPCTTPRASAQGDLTPPGAPAPTMKTLTQIWDRIGVLEAANAQQAQQIAAQTNILNALAAAQGLLGWSFTTVDRAGDVGADNSIAIAPNGHPAIGYFDPNTNQLKYATFNGSAWAVSTVPDLDTVGGYISLAFTPGGQPAMCYYDDVLDNLNYVVFDGSTWTVELVDSAGDVGRHGSLVFAPNGRPAIAYFDATNVNLKYAIRGTTLWVRTTVDNAASVGYYASLAFGPNGQPSIAYRDGNGPVKYAAFNGVWSSVTIDDGGFGLALIFTSTGQPAVAYQRVTDLKYTVFNGSTWITTVVDTGHDAAWIDMALTPGGQPAMTYCMDTNPIGQDGKRALMKYAVLNGTAWSVSTVQLNETSSLTHSTLAFPAHGQPVIAFKQGGDLKAATRQLITTP
ncbi:MAG: hypothetical protein ACKV19_29105 [Verrucomicrobiales bacterium]